MASNNFRDRSGIKTRLQEVIQKRRAEEQSKQIAELKRQKKLFAASEVIGPRDILVNSNHLKMKLEEEVGCGSSVKQELLKVESLSTDVLEFDESLVVKVEEIFDLEKFAVNEQSSNNFVLAEQNETLVTEVEQPFSSPKKSKNLCIAGIDTVPKHNKYSENYVKLLKILVGQKDKEINTLTKLISDFPSSTLDHESEHIQTHDCSSNIDDTNVNSACSSRPFEQVVAQLNSDLKAKDIKIKALSYTMYKMQEGIFAKVLQQSFEMVLPFLYPELQLNDILACRSVCQGWRAAVDSFLDTYPSSLPFEQETQIRENLNSDATQRSVRSHNCNDCGKYLHFHVETINISNFKRYPWASIKPFQDVYTFNSKTPFCKKCKEREVAYYKHVHAKYQNSDYKFVPCPKMLNKPGPIPKRGKISPWKFNLKEAYAENEAMNTCQLSNAGECDEEEAFANEKIQQK